MPSCLLNIFKAAPVAFSQVPVAAFARSESSLCLALMQGPHSSHTVKYFHGVGKILVAGSGGRHSYQVVGILARLAPVPDKGNNQVAGLQIRQPDNYSYGSANNNSNK